MITTQDTLGQLAAAHPWASKIFQQFKLDYCCQGARSLDTACKEAGIDTANILSALHQEENLSSPTPDWEESDDVMIMEHIVRFYHDSHRKELPRLINMADKVESVHRGKPGVPEGLGKLLRSLFQDIETHMNSEEERVFPAIRGHKDGLAPSLRALRTDHENAGQILQQITQVTSDFSPPRHACTTWKALYLGLSAFKKDLMDHVHLEEHVLFPRQLCHER